MIPGRVDLGTTAAGSLAVISLFSFFSCFKDSDYNVVPKIRSHFGTFPTGSRFTEQDSGDVTGLRVLLLVPPLSGGVTRSPAQDRCPGI